MVVDVRSDALWALRREVEEFLYLEADLLDDRQYSEWLELLTDDIQYFMPIARNLKYGQQDQEYATGPLVTAWFDEGKETIVRRVEQIQTGIHWAEEPLSRTTHMVTNLRILEATPSVEDATEVLVGMRFLVYRNRLEDEQDFLIGKRKDTLRRVDGAWKIAKREIFLDQTVLLAKNLTIFL
jgi:3-phenylpropionate/cinnamic acid dioxygenase small subunit